jgi:type IV pilus assembly protein PilX
VILLIGAVAMVRSMNTSLFTAGNYGFKRDLTNQGERAMAQIITVCTTGGLSTKPSRLVTTPASNYSSVLLANNEKGIPTALLATDSNFTAGVAGNDIVIADRGVTIRYLIDRLCLTNAAVDATNCTLGVEGADGVNSQELRQGRGDGQSINGQESSSLIQPVYRVTMRVTGPRRTQAFFQSTFTVR